MRNNSSASARLAAAIFFRAFLDALNMRSSVRAVAHREDALAWLEEFGYDFLLIAGVPSRRAAELMAWVMETVTPLSNTGSQNELYVRPYRAME